ncbi:S-adenosyl-L-methionine-dependent methyltransferase [Dactylonectria macrodidyma]|uniref:S-adenosyl-L-methionine-dependent methyltransferase n=1 Tax=Dactylonectria macrodidyma TaxID=307937 RepID=A0A9P9IVN3_9HYPO|nr:S-adenosyl-L-methionine-dependent methyltransferase [Dactylonectria macrodidyma]
MLDEMATAGGDLIVAPDDDIADDRDSALGDDTTSSTESMRSSILDYRHENGRTYHRYKDGKYNFPNDDKENERLDLEHHLCLATLDNKLGLSPPNLPDSKVKRVLDLGTGTGIWAIDFGDEHPDAEIIGVDLSPIQPDFIPPNVRFLIDDIDEDWDYSEPFDYIHSRMMNFSVQNWTDYLRKIFQNLAPGGYVELLEVDGFLMSDDGTLTEDHALWKWCKLLREAAGKLGRPYEQTDKFKNIMAEVGFTDVVEARFKWPTNRWPYLGIDKKYKALGTWNNENTSLFLESATLAPFTRGLGWSKEEVHVFLVDVRKDLNDPKIHAYSPICSVYGRKPEASGNSSDGCDAWPATINQC